METQSNVGIMVLITLAMGHAKEDMDTVNNMVFEMNVKMTDMNERLLLSEKKLVKTEMELAVTRADLMSKTKELEREVAILKAPPFLHVCGSNSGITTSGKTVPYTSLLYSSTNTEGGGLDMESGVFTAPLGGTYSVSWDLVSWLDHDDTVLLFLQKNGETINDSWHYSCYEGPSGRAFDQGKGRLQNKKTSYRMTSSLKAEGRQEKNLLSFIFERVTK